MVCGGRGVAVGQLGRCHRVSRIGQQVPLWMPSDRVCGRATAEPMDQAARPGRALQAKPATRYSAVRAMPWVLPAYNVYKQVLRAGCNQLAVKAETQRADGPLEPRKSPQTNVLLRIP